MRKLPLPDFDTEEEENAFHDQIKTTDYRASPEYVLREVDRKLNAYGLEVVWYEIDADSYFWTIAEMGKPMTFKKAA